MKRLVSIVAVIAVLLLPTIMLGWGREGHEVVGTLAEAMLSDKAKAGVQSVLGNVTLASVANWADQIRQQRQETYNWHFVDIPRNVATFDDGRDCFLPNDTHPGAATDHMNCVVDRIAFFKQVLADATKTPTERQEALKFIVHFVGDVHQPFHAVGDARGANDIHITEFGTANCNRRPCNLHAAWDSGLIDHTGMGVDAYVQHLQQLITRNHLTASGNPEDWANESHAAGQTAWLDDGGVVDEAYYKTQIQVVDLRLALAGLRLAALLEDVFGTGSSTTGSTGTGSTTTGSGQTAVVRRNTKLRRDASSSHKALETLHKGELRAIRLERDTYLRQSGAESES